MTRNVASSRKRIDVIEILRRLAADRIGLGKRQKEKIEGGGTLTQKEHDSPWEHPLLCATELVAERTGFPPQDVQEFAERVGTALGLNYLKGRNASWASDAKPDRRDLHFMCPKIRELDVDELLNELELSHAGVKATLGIKAAVIENRSRKRIAADSVQPQIEKLQHDVAKLQRIESIVNAPRNLGVKAKPTGTVNDRMAGTIMTDPEAMGWNSTKWARHLKCGRSTVVETATWKRLESARLHAKAEQMKDRRRKPKASDSRRD